MRLFSLISIILFPIAVLASSFLHPENLIARHDEQDEQDGPRCFDSEDCYPRFGEEQYCDRRYRKCVAVGDVGAECKDGRQCKSHECIGNICSVVLDQPCQETADCNGGSGYYCSRETKKCLQASFIVGTPCTFDDQCSYTRCLDGVCRKPPGTFASSCSSSSECNSPYVCYAGAFSDGKKCLEKDGSPGSPCSRRSDCDRPLDCESGTCTAQECKRAGGGCSNNQDCCSRDCHLSLFCN